VSQKIATVLLRESHPAAAGSLPLLIAVNACGSAGSEPWSPFVVVGFAGEWPVQKRSLAIVALVLGALPALSQDVKAPAASASECADKFKAADINKDGVLTVTEIPKVQQIPPALAKNPSLVGRQEFMAACGKMPSAQARQFDKPAPPSPHSTGKTISPDTKGVQQPQGLTGPIDTKGRSAPAESPQGQTPPGMQAAPEGSSKTIIDPSAAPPAKQ
jgi:hypothetical protein